MSAFPAGYESIVLLLSAAAAGVVDAIAGGGGLISIPAFLTAGVPIPLLLGTNKCMACVGSTVALWRYQRGGLMPRLAPRTWALLIAMSIGFSTIGALVSQLPWVLERLRFLIPLLLVSVMAFLVHRWFLASRGGLRSELNAPDAEAVLGPGATPGTRGWIAAISTYDGLFGPGTGTFFLSMLESRGFSTMTANALTKAFNVSSNMGALVYFVVQGKVLWATGLSAAAAYMVGNYVGSGLVLKRGQGLVRITVLTMTSLMLLRYAWSR